MYSELYEMLFFSIWHTESTLNQYNLSSSLFETILNWYSFDITKKYIWYSLCIHVAALFIIITAASITGNHYLIKKANESITFHCKVTGGERIIWRQNGKQLNLEVTGVVNNPSLQLKKLNRLDKGNFTCETCLKRITARSRILQLDVRGKS